MENPTLKTCLITGVNGYLGSEVSAHLRHAGWRVIGASRQPDGDAIVFNLAEGIAPGALDGIDALVHCAYDFGPSSWEEIYEHNVVGTMKLLDEAKTSQVKTIVTISSISAFPECKSLYGKAKLEIEKATLAAGGIALRPGLIYGGSNHGMYGRLARQVSAGRPVPLIVGSPCIQYLIHVEDLCGVVEALLSGKVETTPAVWTIAHAHPWPFRELLQAIAKSQGKTVSFIPVPWQIVWLGLRTLETLGLKLGFKSDSVRSLVYQNPRPELGRAEAAGLKIREFQV